MRRSASRSSCSNPASNSPYWTSVARRRFVSQEEFVTSAKSMLTVGGYKVVHLMFDSQGEPTNE
jgi:hypothetical protein